MRHLTLIALVSLCIASFSCNSSDKMAVNKNPLPASTSTQTPERVFRELDLEVNGIKSGTTYKEIVKKIGKPASSEDFGEDECSGGFMRTITYKGLTIKLESDEKKQNYAVVGIVVTSAKWMIGNQIRIGSSREEVLKAFGPAMVYDDVFHGNDRMPRLDYVTKGNTGGITFLLLDGKVVEVVMYETLC